MWSIVKWKLNQGRGVSRLRPPLTTSKHRIPIRKSNPQDGTDTTAVTIYIPFLLTGKNSPHNFNKWILRAIKFILSLWNYLKHPMSSICMGCRNGISLVAVYIILSFYGRASNFFSFYCLQQHLHLTYFRVCHIN